MELMDSPMDGECLPLHSHETGLSRTELCANEEHGVFLSFPILGQHSPNASLQGVHLGVVCQSPGSAALAPWSGNSSGGETSRTFRRKSWFSSF
ncbi:hypothetical protein UPYG_G00072530 [Umbra pygmaea]|uniref:Uncharacterized protein n=1 Tax=Umbra pygmaea TaxID=75934 RepID=A0ABD0Y1E1_UMBPY